jgi:hypothetical protein
MSYLLSKFDPSQPNLLYYDLNIKNFVNDTQQDSQQLSFIEQRSGAIITNCDDYEFSIVRFQVDSWNLPVFFCQIQKGQSDINLSIYSFTLEYDNGTDPVTNLGAYYIEWSPEDTTVPLPNPPTSQVSGFQVESPYYNCTSFTWWIQLINDKLVEAYNDLKTAIPGDPVVQLSTAPFLDWDFDSNKATLYADSSLYDKDLYPRVSIYFNRAMYGLFSTFPYKIYDTDPTYNKEYLLIVNSFNGSKVEEIGLNSYIIVPQFVTTVNNWSPISAIVFTSSFIPVVANQYSSQQIYYNNQLIQLGAVGNAFANVITDISLESDSGYIPNILYNPQAEYRMLSMHQNSNISTLDIKVWYRSKLSGNLQPFILASGASCSLKMMFRKRRDRI